MSRLHILHRIGPDLYDAVIHAPVPKGTNSAGVEWSAAIVAAGLNRTSLPAGLISEDEAKQIAAGTVIEGRVQHGDDTGLENAVAMKIILDEAIPTDAKAAVATVVGRKIVDGEEVDAVEDRYARGADTNLDSLVEAAHEKAKSDYIDREIDDLIKETMARLDRYGETVT